MIYHLGPRTMHRIGRDGLRYLNIKQFAKVAEGDVAIFAFGEIDVRCHVAKQKEIHLRSIDEVIDTLARNYIKVIVENRDLFGNLMCIVYSVVPPTDHSNNLEFPKFGTLEERVRITQMLNHRLKFLCSASGISFLDVYEDFADENGVLRFDLSDQSVHIDSKQNQKIREKLFELISDGVDKVVDRKEF